MTVPANYGSEYRMFKTILSPNKQTNMWFPLHSCLSKTHSNTVSTLCKEFCFKKEKYEFCFKKKKYESKLLHSWLHHSTLAIMVIQCCIWFEQKSHLSGTFKEGGGILKHPFHNNYVDYDNKIS